MVGALRGTSQFRMGAMTSWSQIYDRHYVAINGIIAGAVFLAFTFAVAVATVQSRNRQAVPGASFGVLGIEREVDDEAIIKPLILSTDSQAGISDASSAPATVSADVVVNGQSLPLPADGNGTVQKVVTSDNGQQTSVNVTMESNASSSTSSSLNLDVESSTTQSTAADSTD